MLQNLSFDNPELIQPPASTISLVLKPSSHAIRSPSQTAKKRFDSNLEPSLDEISAIDERDDKHVSTILSSEN